MTMLLCYTMHIHTGIDVVGEGAAFSESAGVAEVCVTFDSAPNSTATVTVQTGRDSDTAQGKSTLFCYYCFQHQVEVNDAQI